MVLSYLRGLTSESELNRIIAKLVRLDAKPVSKLAQSRWILSEGVITRLLKTARYGGSSHGRATVFHNATWALPGTSGSQFSPIPS